MNSISEFTHEIFEAMNYKVISLATFIDRFKAFDTVNHHILIGKSNMQMTPLSCQLTIMFQNVELICKWILLRLQLGVVVINYLSNLRLAVV